VTRTRVAFFAQNPIGFRRTFLADTVSVCLVPIIGHGVSRSLFRGIDVRSRLAYYRDSNGKEIDLIILENGILYPIEIKKAADPGKEALKNFKVLESLPNEIGEGAVICLASMIYPLDSKNKIVPIGAM